MANQFVSVQEPSSPTKKMQTFENTIASNVVEAEAITLVDSTGIEKATTGNPVKIDPTGTTTQPVSGTVTANAGTGTFTTQGIANDPETWADITATGTLTDAVGTVVLNVAGRVGVGFILTGTWSGNVVFQGTVDGTTWTTVAVHQVAGGWISILTSNGSFQSGVIAGFKQVRVKFLTFTSGSLTVSMLENLTPGYILDFASSSGGSVPPEFAAIAGVDGGTNIVRRIEALITNPVGTEPGLVVRPIGFPSGLPGYVVSHDSAVLGEYFVSSGKQTILATAQGATVGFFWLINPVSSGIVVRVKRVNFKESPTAATQFVTVPRITIERVTFTGTASGTTISPAKRDSNDAANIGLLITASTGLTLTAGNVIITFLVPPVVLGSGTSAAFARPPTFDIFDPDQEDRALVLRPGEGIVCRQPDAGSTSDTRTFVLDVFWAESST